MNNTKMMKTSVVIDRILNFFQILIIICGIAVIILAILILVSGDRILSHANLSLTLGALNLSLDETSQVVDIPALKLSLIFKLIAAAVMFAFAGDFTRMFVDAAESEIIAKSVLFLQTSCPFWIFLGTLCVLRYSIQGLGFTRLAMMSGVFEMVARIAASLWLVPALQFKGVCLGDPLAWMAACLFLIPAMTWIYRRTLHPEGLHGQRIPVGQH